MNYKSILKFYFNADGLNGAMDSLLIRYATASADSVKGWEFHAERVCKLIEAKQALSELWRFLDGVLSSVTEDDRRVLKEYSGARRKAVGEGRRAGEENREGEKALHRSLMKFSRRVSGRLERFAEQVKVLREYYCLIGVPGR